MGIMLVICLMTLAKGYIHLLTLVLLVAMMTKIKRYEQEILQNH